MKQEDGSCFIGIGTLLLAVGIVSFLGVGVQNCIKQREKLKACRHLSDTMDEYRDCLREEE